MPPASTVGRSCVYVCVRSDGFVYCGQTDDMRSAPALPLDHELWCDHLLGHLGSPSRSTTCRPCLSDVFGAELMPPPLCCQSRWCAPTARLWSSRMPQPVCLHFILSKTYLFEDLVVRSPAQDPQGGLRPRRRRPQHAGGVPGAARSGARAVGSQGGGDRGHQAAGGRRLRHAVDSGRARAAAAQRPRPIGFSSGVDVTIKLLAAEELTCCRRQTRTGGSCPAPSAGSFVGRR